MLVKCCLVSPRVTVGEKLAVLAVLKGGCCESTGAQHVQHIGQASDGLDIAAEKKIGTHHPMGRPRLSVAQVAGSNCMNSASARKSQCLRLSVVSMRPQTEAANDPRLS